jgi:hypothetical protein
MQKYLDKIALILHSHYLGKPTIGDFLFLFVSVSLFYIVVNLPFSQYLKYKILFIKLEADFLFV